MRRQRGTRVSGCDEAQPSMPGFYHARFLPKWQPLLSTLLF